MNEVLASVHASSSGMALGLSALAGGALGAAFFGGLWWSTSHAATSPTPALWVFSSLLLRMSSTLWGFYLVADGRWERMLMCLLGFVVARVIVLRLRLPMKRAHAHAGTSSAQAHHAS